MVILFSCPSRYIDFVPVNTGVATATTTTTTATTTAAAAITTATTVFVQSV